MNNLIQPTSTLSSTLTAFQQTLSFAPLAWLKVLHLMSHHRAAVAFTGIPRAEADPLYLEDVEVPRQQVHGSSVKLLIEHRDRLPKDPEPSTSLAFAASRVLIVAGTPSLRAEDAMGYGFARSLDWWAAVHVSRNARPTAWLIFNNGPKAKVEVSVHVDWRRLSRDLLDCEGQLDLLVGSWIEEYGRRSGTNSGLEVPAS